MDVQPIIQKLKSTRTVDVAPTFPAFERNLERLESELYATMKSFREEIRAHYESDDTNLAGKFT